MTGATADSKSAVGDNPPHYAMQMERHTPPHIDPPTANWCCSRIASMPGLNNLFAFLSVCDIFPLARFTNT
ncbi:hypothetical protein [Candidatus Spongiihabitans sp.]|uniref:hypothetical protein n=1 Tax=Candidatus Spongiihabitans sp. TaxID=3101308 RepID=UPI003C7ED70A